MPERHSAPMPLPGAPAALFLDFDGTLVDIAARPDAVVVEEGLPGTLARLRDALGGALAIVSGRPLGTIDAYLAPARFDVAGLHGAEQRIGDVVLVERSADPRRLRGVVAWMQDTITGRAGLILEDKGRSVALHWRLAPALRDFAGDVIATAARELGSDYRVQDGKDVLEILPLWATKGSAIARFMDSPPYRGRRPVFIGDDRTDEHGFDVVASMGGMGIRIGAGETVATRRMDNPSVLRHWLTDCAARGSIDFEEDIP
jgi:trehalose 6-phosphate phosphatase